MDETPLFYEYLPTKVVDIKGSKNISTWKGGLEKKKATLILGVTATGSLLKPSLILARKTRYNLTTRNRIGMKFFGTKNGWIDSATMILWLEEILIPHVDKNKTLLVLDSYAAHYTSEVRKHLEKYPNIHLAVIPGGLTPILQPLDFSVNAIFKRYIKESS